MKYIAIIFITILTFIVPVNVNAQDSEDIVFELLFEALDSLEISQQMNVRAERIVRQERQTNDSLRTVILDNEKQKDRQYIMFMFLLGIMVYFIWNRKKKIIKEE